MVQFEANRFLLRKNQKQRLNRRSERPRIHHSECFSLAGSVSSEVGERRRKKRGRLPHTCVCESHMRHVGCACGWSVFGCSVRITTILLSTPPNCVAPGFASHAPGKIIRTRVFPPDCVHDHPPTTGGNFGL